MIKIKNYYWMILKLILPHSERLLCFVFMEVQHELRTTTC